jgi:hypothetical protein
MCLPVLGVIAMPTSGVIALPIFVRKVTRVEDHLALPVEEKEAAAQSLFNDLAAFTAEALCTD